MIEQEEVHRLRSRGPEGNDQVEIGGGWGSDGMGLVARVRRLIYLPWASFNQGNLI